MIYRRPIRDVVEERHGRTCGIHVFVFYVVALSIVLAMSTACLSATESGYFFFKQEVDSSNIKTVDGRSKDSGVTGSVDFEIRYGWRSMCSKANVTTNEHVNNTIGIHEPVNMPPI